LAVKSRSSSYRKKQTRQSSKRREIFARYLPAWLLLAVVFVLMLPNILVFMGNMAVSAGEALPGIAANAARGALNIAGDAVGSLGRSIGNLFRPGRAGAIAPLFTNSVLHWEDSIRRWAHEYNLDPNLMATLMQIESCGHPTVSSHAGAQGLFQVMPYHFEQSENQLDPDTNARRSAGVISDCLRRANGDAGLAMACYNGGPGVLNRDFSAWPGEPQRFYRWGSGIYADAQRNNSSSRTLDDWLSAGGVHLCNRAAAALGMN
jgi:soluble lytic murein transglycosylase-like protein